MLDETKQYVQKIMACGVAFPIGAPTGAAANFNSDTPFNMETANQVSIPFKCQGYIYNDPLLIYQFNRVVAMFNKDMVSDNLKSSSSLMRKLTPAERDVMRGYGYPRINPRTNELSWYVYRADYDRVMGAVPSDDFILPTYGVPSIPNPEQG